MKALIVVVLLCAGGYFAWSYYKPPVEIKKAEPVKQEQQAVPAQKSEAELAKEREEAVKKQADEAAAKLKEEAAKQAKNLEDMKTDLASKKEEWRKLKEERKKYSAALDEAKDKGWSNIDAIPSCQQECKAAFERLSDAKKQLAAAKDKMEEAEKLVKRSSSGLDNFAKSKSDIIGWRYADENPGVCHPLPIPEHRKKPIKYIEKKGVSSGQQGEIAKSRSALDSAKAEYDSVKSSYDAVEKEFKAAGEKYADALNAKIAESKAKAKALMEAGKELEEKLAALDGGKKDSEKDDDEG